MKYFLHYLICFVLLLFVKQNTMAQCVEPQATTILHGNDVRASFRNAGDMFWDGTNSLYEVAITPTQTVNSIFAGALWIGAYDTGGNLRTACQTYRAMETDFWAGPLSDTTGLPLDCAGFDRIWQVHGNDVRSFLADYSDNGVVDNPIPNSILAWPAKGNANSLAINNLVLPNQDLAPFFDNNGDGVYNPYQGDYPIADPDYPQVIADDLLWTVFNDNGGSHTVSHGDPLKVEVHRTAYAFHCEDDDLIDKTIFVRHKIINKSATNFVDFKTGLWTDFDLGCLLDDGIGTIPQLNSVYTYNMDNDDEINCNLLPPDTSTTGYGSNPPVQSITFLNKNISSSMYHVRSSSDPKGPPYNSLQHYRLLSSTWANGVPLSLGGYGYDDHNNNLIIMPCVFPDNPNAPTSWSMYSENYTWLDPLAIIATSEHSVPVASSFDLVAAYSLHVHADSNHLQNINLMYQQIPDIQGFYANGYATSACEFTVPISRISNNMDNAIQVYPNPAKDMVTIESQNANLESIELFNALGQSVYSKININNSNIQLPISNLPNGIYVIKARNGGQIWSEKLTIAN